MAFYRMSDGQSLFVREIGKGQPVLILSGLGMKSWQWLPFLFPLQQKFKFFIPDWRGFGLSADCDIPEDIHAIESHWSDLQQILKQAQIEKCIVIAYSMGATTAMHGMQYGDFSEYIQTYLHIDQSPKIAVDATWEHGLFAEQHQQFRQYLHQLSALLTHAKNPRYLHELSNSERYFLVHTWQELIEFQGSNQLFPALFKLAKEYPFLQSPLLPLQRLDYLAWYLDTYLNHQEDYRPAITQLTCPTTFFIGMQSRLYPAQGQHMIAQHIPQAKVVEFHQSGHTPLVSEPLKFRNALHDFLKVSL
ncbi:alpha/beta hydrolase [Acinetobacter sp.]|uniref:alpha/beta fold hydrolase n=1 Tax=Acinetobacter sp. TaxID=472 RepID=UPI0031DF928F